MLCLLYFFYIVIFHILILFKGLYPAFGVFAYDTSGIYLLDISIMCLAFLNVILLIKPVMSSTKKADTERMAGRIEEYRIEIRILNR